MCVLTKCCLWIPLRIGAFAVAVVYIIIAVIEIVQYAGAFPSESTPDLLVAHLVFSIIFLLAAIMLLMGVLREDSSLIQPWIWCMMFILIIYAVLVIVYTVQLFNKHKESGKTTLVILLVNLCVELYCLLVVYSYDHTICS